jgi:MFS family permease
LFFINGVSFLAVIFALAAMRDVQAQAGNSPRPLWDSMLSGLHYAWHDRGILALLVLSAVAGIFGRSYQNLLPAFADLWKGGELGYGLLLSSAGGGALIGAFGLASLTELKRQRLVMIISGMLFSLAVLVFALSPNLAEGVLFLFMAGVLSTIFGTIVATFIQIAAPKELRGRLMSLYAITLIGLPSLGALGSGALAEKLGGLQGAPRAVALGAVISAVVLVLIVLWDRRARSQHLPKTEF